VFCHELLNSAVYTFLDDAPLEERRTQAVYTRRASEPRNADDLGALDPQAIQRVREEAWPYATTPDELHDALMLAGFIRESEVADSGEEAQWPALMHKLIADGRAVTTGGFWVAIERFEELAAAVPQKKSPKILERLRKTWTREDAARELIRGRMEVLGPVTAGKLTRDFGIDDERMVSGALLELETEGRILRGYFTPVAATFGVNPTSPLPNPKQNRGLTPQPRSSSEGLEWCDRRLLARIHRYTINRLRAEIEAATAADFMRFLMHWQHVAPEQQVNGVEGLAAVVEQLDGYELAASAWEHDVLPSRVRDYSSSYIDMLCLSGRVAWGRITPMDGASKAPLKSSPIAIMQREHTALWRVSEEVQVETLTSQGRAIYEALTTRGALFFHELVAATGLLRTHVERALGELAGAGLVTADSFSGLRALLTPSEKRKSLSGGRPSTRRSAYGVDTAGRWGLLAASTDMDREQQVETIARTLLRRYGVVFRSLITRESRLPTWRELVMVYRRLEARGEIRGGRFVSGFGGEQFALPDAVGRLRAVRRLPKSGELTVISAADPLNLVGILTPDARVSSIAQNRVAFRDGVAVGAWEGGKVRRLAASELDEETLHALLSRRASAHPLKAHFRSASKSERDMLERKRAFLPQNKPAGTLH
jgi:ATP-dependent Lhr-like helicase